MPISATEPSLNIDVLRLGGRPLDLLLQAVAIVLPIFYLDAMRFVSKADAALARSARKLVLVPKAFEVPNYAVVHLDGHIDDERALRMLERF